MMFSDLGASAIGMPVPAVPESLSKGVIDAAALPWETTAALRVPEMVHYHTEFEGKALYTSTFIVAMNKQTGKTVWRTERSVDYQDLDQNGKPKRDGDFRNAVDQYIDDFERLLKQVSQNDDDQMMSQMYLTSEPSKVYAVLRGMDGRPKTSLPDTPILSESGKRATTDSAKAKLSAIIGE